VSLVQAYLGHSGKARSIMQWFIQEMKVIIPVSILF
jgi:hypothetical protein